MRAIVLAAAAFAACAFATGFTPASAKDAPAHLTYLDPALFDPALDIPAPPAHGSAEETREIDALRRLIAGASKERLAQADADGKREDPSIFNASLGLDLKTLPATWALLTTVQSEGEILADTGKTLFHRLRPYSADPHLPTCQPKNPARLVYRSYPSGHSMLGYSVGWMLARLAPAKAGAVLERAHQYALSRQYCGAHFASDTEASHVLGTLAAATLFNDPRLAAQIAAARAELSRH